MKCEIGVRGMHSSARMHVCSVSRAAPTGRLPFDALVSRCADSRLRVDGPVCRTWSAMEEALGRGFAGTSENAHRSACQNAASMWGEGGLLGALPSSARARGVEHGSRYPTSVPSRRHCRGFLHAEACACFTMTSFPILQGYKQRAPLSGSQTLSTRSKRKSQQPTQRRVAAGAAAAVVMGGGLGV